MIQGDQERLSIVIFSDGPKNPKTAPTQCFKIPYITGFGVLMLQKCQVNGVLEFFPIKSISCNLCTRLENPELFVENGFILHLKDTNLNSTNIVSVVL